VSDGATHWVRRRPRRLSGALGVALIPLLLLPTALGAQPEATATKSVRGLLDQARALASRNEADAAAEALGRAVALAPNSEDVLNAYARFSLARGNPIQATLALEPLARMHPGEAEYAYLLGVARMQVGEMAQAAEVLQEAAALDPGRALTHIGLGLALNRVDRFDEARESLAAALRLEPDNVEALAAMSEAVEGLGNLDEATRLADRALAVNPDHPTALVTIGTARLKEGRFEEAREALARAVAAEPDSIKGHYQFSLALARLGDRAGAERHLALSREAQAAIEQHIERLRARPPLGSRTEP